METKICKQCGVVKDIFFFSKKYKTKDGIQKYQTLCKDCFNENGIKRKLTNDNKQKRSEYDIEYYKNNREKILKIKKDYHKNNREEILKKKKEYRKIPENRERANEYIKKYIKENREKYYEYRRKNQHIIAWRRLLYRSLYYLEKKKEGNTFDELQYTPLQLKQHLEKQFVEGMNWENYGKWEIDHIKPLTSFDKDTEPSVVNSLDNLQPLWKKDNIAKYNHIL